MMKAFSDDPPTCHVLQCLNLSNVMQYKRGVAKQDDFSKAPISGLSINDFGAKIQSCFLGHPHLTSSVSLFS